MCGVCVCVCVRACVRECACLGDVCLLVCAGVMCIHATCCGAIHDLVDVAECDATCDFNHTTMVNGFLLIPFIGPCSQWLIGDSAILVGCFRGIAIEVCLFVVILIV